MSERGGGRGQERGRGRGQQRGSRGGRAGRGGRGVPAGPQPEVITQAQSGPGVTERGQRGRGENGGQRGRGRGGRGTQVGMRPEEVTQVQSGQGGADNRQRGRGGDGLQRGRGRDSGQRGRGGFHLEGTSGQSRGERSDRGGPGRGRGRDRGRGRGLGAVQDPSQVFMYPDEENGVTPPDERVKTLEDKKIADQFTKRLASISLAGTKEVSLPLRPAYREVRNPIVVRANYLAVSVNTVERTSLFPYSVSFTSSKKGKESEVSDKRKRKQLITMLLQQQPFSGCKPGLASDYDQEIVTTKALPKDTEDYTISYFDAEGGEEPGDAVVYTAKVTSTGEVSPSALLDYCAATATVDQFPGKETIIRVLNIVLTQHARHSGQVSIFTGIGNRSNKFFASTSSSENPFEELTGGLVAIRGYYASLRTSTARLIVNLNVCAGAFYATTNLAEIARQFLNVKEGYAVGFIPKKRARDLKAFLKMRRIRYDYMKDGNGNPKPIIRTIRNLSENGPSLTSENFEPEGPMRVSDYFKKKLKIQLEEKNAKLPMLVFERDGKPEYVPMELCSLAELQPYRKQLTNATQTKKMVNFASRAPYTNQKYITEQGVKYLGFTGGSQPTLEAFGLKVGGNLLTVPAEVLDAPKLAYENGEPIIKEASWNLKNSKFRKLPGVPTERLAFFFIKNRNPQKAYKPKMGNDIDTPEEFEKAREFLQESFEAVGIKFREVRSYEIAPLSPEEASMEVTLRSELSQIKKSWKPNFTIIIVPDDNTKVYNCIKYLCDVELGLLHLCVQGKGDKLGKLDKMYGGNLSLKVNLKLGGDNHTLTTGISELTKVPTMLMGVDVTHPPPDSPKGTPSVVGMVSTVDHSFMQYRASIDVQKRKDKLATEIVEKDVIVRMTTNALKKFEKISGELPKRIFLYRDGVGESQFETVVRDEVAYLKEAFSSLYPKKRQPQLLVVVCGKRHHTRFYPTSKDQLSGRQGNVPPGTCVDRGITHETLEDFYIVAHAGLQGTVRPAHYTVVYKDLDPALTPTQIHDITHSLSYLYGRATKAVSICPPAYYADKLCDRARIYLTSVANMYDGSEASSGRGRLSKEEKEEEKEKVFLFCKEKLGKGVHPDIENVMFWI